MSEADKMFEKLGHKKVIDNTNILQYDEYKDYIIDYEVRFDLKDKTIIVEFSNGESLKITMQELQAINLKTKELGWNE